jgi:hypothetical protein
VFSIAGVGATNAERGAERNFVQDHLAPNAQICRMISGNAHTPNASRGTRFVAHSPVRATQPAPTLLLVRCTKLLDDSGRLWGRSLRTGVARPTQSARAFCEARHDRHLTVPFRE